MLAFEFPEAMLLALRWLLLLGPIALVVGLARLRSVSEREKIGGLFAFLYGAPLIFLTHLIVINLGGWRYGWDALMVNGMPADVLLGGAILFGPGLFFAFPKVGPLMICLPIIIGLHATLFNSLEPLVFAGPYWFAGVVFVFLTAHIPAIYLAKWTAEDRLLPMRCALLALMTGGMILIILPSLIMLAMGGEWALFERPIWAGALALIGVGFASTLGLAANQMLCLQGGGTPIPLDPTKRLVRSGIYAYVSNPMQLSAALCWIVLGLYLQNIWIIAAAAMAWVFVQGMVRWHHRHDLLKRFPDGWPEYKANVPEWIPRWRPWVCAPAKLSLNAREVWLMRQLHNATGIEIEQRDGPPTYQPAGELRAFSEGAARLFALTHVNFAWAVLAHVLLLGLMGWKFLHAQVRQPAPVRP